MTFTVTKAALSIDALSNFEEAIAAHRHAYVHASCSMLVRRIENGAYLIRATLALSPVPNNLKSRVVEVGPFYACHFKFDECGLQVGYFLRSLLEGRLLGPDRSFLIRRGGAGIPNPSFVERANYLNAPQPQSQPSQRHVAEVFGIGFGDTYLHPYPSLLHQLRTADTPYASLYDLLTDFGLADVGANIHVFALPPIELDLRSRIEGTRAEIGVLLSKHLDRSKASIGVIATTSNGVELRRQVNASSLEWSDFPGSTDVYCGKVELDVPQGSVLHCFASYDAKCFNDYLLSDPKGSLNPLRAIYEEFDPDFARLKEQLTSDRTRASADDKEQAVARLLWMLGFAAIHIGAKNAQAPDVIALSSQGNVLVIECTSAGLKIDNKLQLLLDRTKAIRDCLDRTNHSKLACIPVMVAFRDMVDVSADIETYEQRGVAVFTRNDIDDVLGGTFSYPLSEAKVTGLRKRIDDALKKHADRQLRIEKTIETVENMERETRSLALNLGRR